MGFCLSPSLLLTLALLLSLTTDSTAQKGRFKCSSPGPCRSLVGYITPNETTLSSLQSLFTVRNLRSLLGANNLPVSTKPTHVVPANQTIRIPVPCICYNGTGVSNRVPVYTVVKDDGLYHIAADVYMGLVDYDHIQEVNKIPNPDLILVGQKLWIPLPCSCDEVDGKKVVHYGHLVAEGSTVEEIADDFGTDEETLLRVNGIANDSQLIASQAFDVPLKACNSSVRSDSLDYPLLVSNGTYVFTANNCVKCMCDAANNWTLHCEPSNLQPAGNCSSMQCEGSDSLYLSNTTESTCSRSTCAYAGFSGQNIHTTLSTESTCETPPPSHASRSGSSWNFLLISIVLCLYLL